MQRVVLYVLLNIYVESEWSGRVLATHYCSLMTLRRDRLRYRWTVMVRCSSYTTTTYKPGDKGHPDLPLKYPPSPVKLPTYMCNMALLINQQMCWVEVNWMECLDSYRSWGMCKIVCHVYQPLQHTSAQNDDHQTFTDAKFLSDT